MEYPKMLVLAMIAAAAFTAVIGVGTASATTLCENNQTTSCASHVALGTKLKFSAEDSIKLSGPFNLIIDTCTSSRVQGTTTGTGGIEGVAVTGQIEEAGEGDVPGLVFEGCVRPTTVKTGGTLSVQHIAGTDNGTVTSNGATITIESIPGFGTCSYVTTATDIGTLTGNLVAPTFDISATIPSETAGCPNGTWSGHYIYTTPTGNAATPFIVSTN
jgi:hypothetical protein